MTEITRTNNSAQ